MKILLGVSSGIAIYKAVDLISRLRKKGHELKVIMTPNATRLISPVVFSSVGNCPVFVDPFDVRDGWIPHTELSRWADVLVIAPATADTTAKIATGRADNLLTLTALAFNKASKVIVPTMNDRMYGNPITQRNLSVLRDNGWFVLEPDEGFLACGDWGKGRYPDNEVIEEAIYMVTWEKPLKGYRILVTAGPTREYFDPVRFISNASSGKMGYALAKVAKRMGGRVHLISGPVSLSPPPFLDEFVKVVSAEEMRREVLERYEDMDVIVMNAAVADYKPSVYSESKIKKDKENLSLVLERNPDILREIGTKKGRRVLVGFSAETENFEENARKKLKEKNLDIVVVNDVRKTVESDTAEVVILTRDGVKKRVGPYDKEVIAFHVFDTVVDILRRSSGENP